MALRSKKRKVKVVTLRSPPPGRYKRILQSLQNIAQASLVTGTVVPSMHLSLNLNTTIAYGILAWKCLGRTGPAIVDIVASPAALFRRRSNLVVDFRTPYPLELTWLGHRTLASLAGAFERIVGGLEMVFAANERMALLCSDLGAQRVHVIPNYPTRGFKPNVPSDKWRVQHGLAPEAKIALFTGGVRLREIYGLDLLLASWRMVEDLEPSCVLVILGDTELEYMGQAVARMGIRRLRLPGRVDLQGLANWVNCADLCLAPRTPGFPSAFYDDKDSTKISEYAALEKPILASGYAPSAQYLLVDPTLDAFSEGIVKGLEGKIEPARPHYWEENERTMLSLLEDLWFR